MRLNFIDPTQLKSQKEKEQDKNNKIENKNK